MQLRTMLFRLLVNLIMVPVLQKTILSRFFCSLSKAERLGLLRESIDQVCGRERHCAAGLQRRTMEPPFAFCPRGFAVLPFCDRLQPSQQVLPWVIVPNYYLGKPAKKKQFVFLGNPFPNMGGCSQISQNPGVGRRVHRFGKTFKKKTVLFLGGFPY